MRRPSSIFRKHQRSTPWRNEGHPKRRFPSCDHLLLPLPFHKGDIYTDPISHQQFVAVLWFRPSFMLITMAFLMGRRTESMETFVQLLSEEAAKYLSIARAFVG